MRLLIAAAAALPAVVMFVVVGLSPGIAERMWWPPAAAAGLALGMLLLLRRNVVLILLTGGLGALAAQSAAEGRAMLDVATVAHPDGALPFFDLRETSLPTPAPPYVAVRGHYRGGWTLDEYAVRPGQLPDQSSDPGAVLVPFTATRDAVIEIGSGQLTASSPPKPGTTIVVARVGPRTPLEGTDPVVLRGKTSPLEPELMETLVQVTGANASDARGVLVDTLAVPTLRDAWLELGLALIALCIAIASAWFAAAPRGPVPPSSRD